MSIKDRLIAIVGEDNVFDDEASTARYGADESIYCGVTPAYVVKPADAPEIRSLIRMANDARMPVVPTSSGRHFNGTTLPAEGGLVIDLGRMTRIFEVDLRNRRARIEPGLPWGEFQDHLRSREMFAANPLFPHPEQSVVTSYLERQPLLNARFEYAEPILTLEAVLPTGDLLRTGSAAAPGAPDHTVADMVCPYGPGLDFYRLFQGAQGTLGIVTWVNIKIEHLSAVRKTYLLPANDLPELLSVVHRTQRLMIGDECFILSRSDLAAIAGLGDFEAVKEIERSLPAWAAVIQISGTRRRPGERVAYQDRAFLDVCGDHGFQPMQETRDIFSEGLRKPWPEARSYWKHARRGGCHDVACHLVYARVPQLLNQSAIILAEAGFGERDYGVYIQPIEYGRAYYLRLHLYHDPDSRKEREKMLELDEVLNRNLLLGGALFNTPYGRQADLTYDHAAMYTEVLKKVKNIFDPQGIMNPGRLCF